MQRLPLREMLQLKDKKTAVIGLARSGVGAANLLADLGAEVMVTDKKTAAELGGYIGQLSPAVRLCLGGYPDNADFDLLVVSPGVPMNIEPVLRARSAGIKVVGELELAYQIIKGKGQEALCERKGLNQPKFLAITGTNGKSTTTTLLDYMLKKDGTPTILGGNIGNALTEEVHKWLKCRDVRLNEQASPAPCPLSLAPAFIVAEVSSFQLESIDEFKPSGAAILNITPDHLDRYSGIEAYREAKAAVFTNQDSNDFLVLNADDYETMQLYASRFSAQGAGLPKVYFFSRQKEVAGVYARDGVVYSNIPDLPQTLSPRPLPLPLIKADEIRLKGVHNLENAMAAAAMALLAGCDREAVVTALNEFPGLEHRLEFVRELEGVRYINDSKGTNVGAVMKSVEGFSEPLILIAGGRDKAGEFSLLRGLVREKVKALVLIGEATEKLRSALGDMTYAVTAPDMSAAVNMARSLAKRGDVVLLSPACASFDMFRDFEDRGRRFKNIVMDLK